MVAGGEGAEHADASNTGQVRDQLLAATGNGAMAVVPDMPATVGVIMPAPMP